MSDLKPIGSALPPRRDQLVQAKDGISARSPSDSIVVPEAKDRFLEVFEREWVPSTVKSTVSSSIFGDLTAQHLLFRAMIDTWPRLQKSLREIKLDVRRAPWKVEPWSRRGDDPTPEAENVASHVEDMIWGMRPDAIRHRLGFEGIVEALVEGYYLGHQIIEPIWELQPDGSWRPTSGKIVPSRFYGYSSHEEGEDRLMLDPTGNDAIDDSLVEFPEHRFLVAVNGGHTGHPASAAPLRALTPYWMAAVYGLRWAMVYSQLFGVPFRWATYADDDDKAEVSKMLANIGTAGWAAFKSGTELKFLESKGGGDRLPQWKLMEMANTECDIFMLGQTLTTEVGDSGSRALGDVHEGVKSSVISGLADFVGEIITHQLVPAIAHWNGRRNTRELPGVWVRFEEAEDETKLAERDERLGVLDGRTPVTREWFYQRHGIPMPADGDDLFVDRKEAEPEDNPGISLIEGKEASDPKAEKKASDLFEEMEKALREGKLLQPDQIAKMLEAAALDGAGDQPEED